MSRTVDLALFIPEIKMLLGVLAGAVGLLGFIPYINDMVRGRTRPQRATWLIWTLVGAALCVAHYQSGERRSLWVPVSFVLGPLTTAAFSVRYGVGGFSALDRVCLAGASGGLLIWIGTGSTAAGLLIMILVDLVGALPTLRESWRSPASESRAAWLCFAAANLMNLGALETWAFGSTAYPTYLFVLSAVMVALLVLRRRLPSERERPEPG